MKRWLALAALYALAFSPITASEARLDPKFQGYWILDVEKSDFGASPKAKQGSVNWTELGYSFAIVTADGFLYTDAVQLSPGCKLLGVASDHTCETKVISPRHLLLTLKQNGIVRRTADIELVGDNVTKTTHRVTPEKGAPYVETTYWNRLSEK